MTDSVEVVSMKRITLTDEDAEHIQDWQRLSSEQKESINKIAKILGDENKRKSFYALLEAQSEISGLLATVAHVGWFGRMFMKSVLIAGGFVTLATFVKIYFGSKP